MQSPKIQNHCKIMIYPSLSVFQKILPKYFSSEWSFAQFRIPDLRAICTFGPQNTLIGTEN